MHFNRSLARGLKILAILNAGGQHRVSTLARAVQLPRSTAFRILCTLVEEGYVWRDPVTDQYHPTALVLGLSDGFDATTRLVQAAQPVVSELGRKLVWPVMLATLSGTSVLVRQTTDASSPLALVRYSPGYRAPVLEKATGRVLLAFSTPLQRQMVLDLLYRDVAAQTQAIPRADVERSIAEVHSLGYATLHRPGHPSDRSSLAVPVQAGPETLAALVVRYARSAVSPQTVMNRFLPELREAARNIVRRFDMEVAGASAQLAHQPWLDRADA
jgi:IclR family mhp operon transcriptional activator